MEELDDSDVQLGSKFSVLFRVTENPSTQEVVTIYDGEKVVGFCAVDPAACHTDSPGIVAVALRLRSEDSPRDSQLVIARDSVVRSPGDYRFFDIQPGQVPMVTQNEFQLGWPDVVSLGLSARCTSSVMGFSRVNPDAIRKLFLDVVVTRKAAGM